MTTSIRKEREQMEKLLRDASDLCDKGQWEDALLLYRQGLLIRPHSMACRAGVQRVSYAIKNTTAGLEDVSSQNLHTVDNNLKEKPKQEDQQNQEEENRQQSIQQYSFSTPNQNFKISQSEGKYFCERFGYPEFKELRFDSEIKNTKESEFPPNGLITDYMPSHLESLLKKRNGSKYQINSRELEKVDRDAMETWSQHVERLEKIHDATELLLTATEHLTALQNTNMYKYCKVPYQGKIYYLLLKANVELGNFEEADKYKEHVLRIAEEIEDEELELRARYLEGRAYVSKGNYDAGARTLKEILKKTINPERSAHLLHEIGRCYFKTDRIETGRAYSVLSLQSATKAHNDTWIKNAAILIAEIETFRGFKEEAIANYEIAKAAASRLNDQRSFIYIVCELSKLGKKLRRPKIEIDDTIPERQISKPQNETTVTFLRRPKIEIEGIIPEQRTRKTQLEAVSILRRPVLAIPNKFSFGKKAKVESIY